MSSSPITDPRAKRWAFLAKAAALLVGGFFIAPFIWTAIGGLVGLVAAGIAIGAIWMVLPAVGSLAANMRMKLIRVEAAKNPVETLMNDLHDKTVALDGRKTQIEKLNGQIRTFADKVAGLKEKYGVNDSGYVKLAGDLTDLKRIALNRAEKWKEAKKQLERYEESIDRAQMIWEAGNAAAAARESSGLTDEDFYARLRAETAFDSIQQNYNEALASLDTSMLEEPAVQAALPAASSTTIDVEVTAPAKTVVRR